MAVFSNNAVTDKGRILLAESQVGALFVPTKIVMGSGTMPSGSTPRSMAAVATPVVQLSINKKRASDDGKVIIGGLYSNASITEAFYFRELGLYAQLQLADGSFSEEVLYAYANAGSSADLMAAASSAVIEKQIDLVTWIGSDTQIDLTIESGAYIPFTDKGAPGGVAALGDDGKVPADQLPEMNYEPLLKDNAAKDTPVDGDSLPLVDSADGSKTKRVLWSRVKAVLKVYFDPIYAAATHSHAWSAITGKPSSFTPALHASTHGSNGTDPVTPAAIGAAAATHQHAAGDINSGTFASDRLPTVPLTKGGTGQTTAAKALYALINGSSALAYSGAAAGDFLALLDASAATGKKISLENLINYMQLLGGVPKIATGSYTGTGTYGADNPCSLTFPFVPKLIMLLGNVGADGSYSPSLGASSGGYCVHLINVDKLTTTYQAGLGLANYSRFDAYGKKSSDGKTFSWYYNYTGSRPNDGINYQCNISGTVYYYAIIG